MKKHPIITHVTFVLFLIGVFILGYYNFKDNADFFKAPFTTLVTITSAVVVSYWLTQSRNDRRAKNQKIDELLYKIQEYISQEDFVKSGQTISTKNLLLHRSIANKINYLQTLDLDGDIKKELAIIDKNFLDFRTLYGNHYTDPEQMQVYYNAFKHHIAKIDDACDKIHVYLIFN